MPSSPAPVSSVAAPAPARNALELEFGALSEKPGGSSQVLGSGPALRLAWRHGSNAPGLHGWTAIALSTGPREGLVPQALRWGYGLESGAGLGVGGQSVRFDAGWSLGAKWIPATGQATSPDDLENAGWLFLATGPELEARFGSPDRWGVVIRLNAEATYLNEAEDIGAAPVLRIGYGGWVGVSLPFRR